MFPSNCLRACRQPSAKASIHGFYRQLVRPYPVETGIDPGAEIIDPAAAELAFQDLMDAWLLHDLEEIAAPKGWDEFHR